MSISEVLRSIRTALDQNSIAYMLTGSFASAYHGTPRSTQDIDVIVEATPAQLRGLVHSCPSASTILTWMMPCELTRPNRCST